MTPTVHLEIRTLVSRLIPLDMDAPNMIELWGYLDNFLSYEVHNNFFIKAVSNSTYVRDMWDGRSHLFNAKTGTFLTGLLPQVMDALQELNISYTVSDYRPKYTPIHDAHELSTTLEVRQYQLDAVNACLKEKRGIIWARPRSGKTIMEIILLSNINLYPVLSICQSIDVARQTVDKFKQFLPGVKVGMIGDGVCDIQDVTVATIQSLASVYGVQEDVPRDAVERPPLNIRRDDIKHLVETAKVVWVDECHHAVSNTHKFVLQNKITSVEYLLGCSGTPFREDNTNLLMEGLIGPIIYEITYSKLIEGGYLVKPTIHLIRLPKSVDIDKSSPYATIYKQAITENGFRNNAIARIVKSLNSRNKTCMVLVNKVTHGKELSKLIPSAEFSYSKSKDREQSWIRLKKRILKCLITTLGDEGVDIPSLDATIIAAGGDSAIKVFQRLRCITPSEGKTRAIVVDFIDPYKYLQKHSKKREALYKSEPSFDIVYREANL